VVVAERENRKLVIPALQPLLLEESKKTTTEPRGSWGTRQYVAATTGAVSIAALAVALVYKIKANSLNSEALAMCDTSAETPACPDQMHSEQLLREARSKENTASMFAVAGALGIGISIVAIFVNRDPPRSARASVVPLAHDRAAGLVVMGRF
jgi:hypothetical protein